MAVQVMRLFPKDDEYPYWYIDGTMSVRCENVASVSSCDYLDYGKCLRLNYRYEDEAGLFIYQIFYYNGEWAFTDRYGATDIINNM